MRTLVLPDLHGDWELAQRLLVEVGMSLCPEDRAEVGLRTVQLGDLAACVVQTVDQDREVLARAAGWFDVVLVGNHEFPYLDGPLFGGFWKDPAVEHNLRVLECEGILRPCLLVGDTLLTHAGVAAEWGFTQSLVAAEVIERAWRCKRSVAPILRQIGPARDWQADHPFGGCIWSDWEETRAPFRQVHGHTPVEDGPSVLNHANGTWAWNLDVGAGKGATSLTALWLDEEGNPDGLEHTTAEAGTIHAS